MAADIPFTIGICAYNEAENIEGSIRSAYSQRLDGFTHAETIVVSGASTDGTDGIVRRLSEEFRSLRLIRQETREGKNSAVNLILDSKSTELIVILNADNSFVDADGLQRLLEPFRDPGVGMVGGHPRPTNDPCSLPGFAAVLFWEMHHRIALRSPKIGELVAYRDLGFRLPTHLQSDEDLVRLNLEGLGYTAVYAPEARIRNRGPETVADLIKQRTRVNIGQCYLQKQAGYISPTWDVGLLYQAMLEAARIHGFRPFKIAATATIEAYARLKAKMHVASDRGDMNVWDPVETTKKL